MSLTPSTSCAIGFYPDPMSINGTCLVDHRSRWEFPFAPNSPMDWLLFVYIPGIWLWWNALATIYLHLQTPSHLSSSLHRYLLDSLSFIFQILSTTLNSFIVVLQLIPFFSDISLFVSRTADSTALHFYSSRVIGFIIPISFSPHPQSVFAQIVKCFDAKQNYAELVSPRDSPLAPVDSFRVVAILWVFMNHLGSEGRIDILERRPSADVFKASVHNHPVFGPLLGNSALGVEIFLILSGVLCSYGWKHSQEPFFKNYIKSSIRRMLRLAPSIVAFLLVAVGPVLRAVIPRFFGTMCAACGISGLFSHLTFVGNLQRYPTCLGYLWYLGLDFQLQLAAPFFLAAHHRNRTLGYSLIAVSVVISMVLRARHCIYFDTCNMSDVDIPFIHVASLDDDRVESMYRGLWSMYGSPLTKAGPFLLGLGFGRWVKEQQTNGSPRMSDLTASRLFKGGFFFAALVIYAIIPEYWYPSMPTNAYNVLYTATFRTLFSVAVLAMMAGVTRCQTPVHVDYRWAILAKLTFAAYLLHMPIAYVFNYFGPLQSTESAYMLVALLLPHAILSFAVALPFHLLVEAPCAKLVNLLFRTMF